MRHGASSGRQIQPSSVRHLRPSDGALIPPGFDHLAVAACGDVSEFHLVADHLTGQIYGLKQLRTEWQDVASVRRMLSNEAKVGLAVRSQYLVRIVNADVQRARPYILFEWLTGSTLEQKLLHEGPLSAGRAVWLARQCALGMQHLLTVGFVHGAIEPKNVWICSLKTFESKSPHMLRVIRSGR